MARRGFGGFPGAGGGNMNALLKQAQKMQQDLAKAQEELAQTEVWGSAGGDMVRVKMNGGHELLALEIKPEAVDPEDVEMLQDLVLAAAANAREQLDRLQEEKMGRFGNMGMGLGF